MEATQRDPAQSRVSTATAEARHKKLQDHKLGNIKRMYPAFYKMMKNGFKDNA
jgi:hypothetical protein